MSQGERRGIDVVLVGYELQENLGLRSILACLRSLGYQATLVPFRPGAEERVLEAVRAHRPRVVGYSIIFQYGLDEFALLMRHLRANGVTAHFTVGGHFASLRPAEALRLLPDADTLVRFEGEQTLPELLEHVDDPAAWRAIRGLAFRAGAEVVTTAPRPKLADLDALPRVARDEPAEAAPGVKMAAMLASRGCLFDCSFCSIRQFYRGGPGALRRVRSPAAVAAEMRDLLDTRGIRYFSFQDDDFAARTESQRRWLRTFLAHLDEMELSREVKWKISCRVTDLEAGILGEMQDRGLVAVYLGVESGSEAGLRTLNKHVTVEENVAALELVKRCDLALAMGFMLFDPSSTVGTLRENIDFLGWAGADGYFPVNFCKMLPYAGTPVEAALRAAGRLKGTTAHPDYSLADPRLDWFETFVQEIFSRRNFGRTGLVALLQQADFEARLARAFQQRARSALGDVALRGIIAVTNTHAVQTLNGLLDAVVEYGGERLLEERTSLDRMAEREWRAEGAAEVALARLQVSLPRDGRASDGQESPPVPVPAGSVGNLTAGARAVP